MSEVSDKDFEIALQNTDNRKIMNAATRNSGVVKFLSTEEIQSCQLIALWESLQKWRPDGGRKFTSFLYQRVYWECLRYVNTINRFNKKNCQLHTNIAEEKMAHDLEINDVMSKLPDNLRAMIQQYFYDGLTLKEIGRTNGCSHETVRRKIKQAIKMMRQLCS